MIGVVIPAVQIRGVAADHAPVWRQEVGKPDAPARDDADRRRSVEKIMLGRLAADLLVGALPAGRVAVGETAWTPAVSDIGRFLSS